MARAIWYLVATAAFAIFIASIPGFYQIAAGGVTDLRFSANPAPIIRILSWVSVLGAAGTGLLSLLLAVFIFQRRPGERITQMTSLFLLIYGVIMAGPIEALEPFLPGIAEFNTGVLIPLFIPFILLLFAVFPDGQFVPAWSRWAVVIAVLISPIGFVWPGMVAGGPLDFSQPLILTTILIIVLLAVSIWGSTLYAQVYRYRRVSTPLQKQQVKWVAYGIGIWFTTQLISTIPWVYSYSLPPGTMLPVWLAAASPIWVVSIAAIPITLTIAVLRYRLFQIDFLINRSLLYGILTIIVIAIYVLVVGFLSVLLNAQGSLMTALIATGLVAVLFQPLRERLQRAVNRMVYGERDDPIAVLSRLGRRLEIALPSGQVLTTLVETIAGALKLPFVGIAIQDQLVAWHGDPEKSATAFPLAFQGNQIGELRAAPRFSDEAFTKAELQLLRNLARQASAAVQNAQLAADLQRSRQNLVKTREEERHRLHRDLHDGLGPTMAALALKLDAARDLVESGHEEGNPLDLEEASEMLAELKLQTQKAVQDIRHIVHDLRPPSIDSLGLVGAIEAHIRQVAPLNGTQIRLTRSPHDFPRLPPAIEVAAYRIVLEAVTNVIHHARAARCEVSLELVGDQLYLEVNDDGIGIDDEHDRGVGLDSMRERAEEVGGRFALENSSRGVRVVAVLPAR